MIQTTKVVYMFTDSPVTVSVLVKVIHFVAVTEMSEVRNDKYFFHIMFCPLVKFQTSTVTIKQFYGISRGHLWGYYEVIRGILGCTRFSAFYLECGIFILTYLTALVHCQFNIASAS